MPCNYAKASSSTHSLACLDLPLLAKQQQDRDTCIVTDHDSNAMVLQPLMGALPCLSEPNESTVHKEACFRVFGDTPNQL